MVNVPYTPRAPSQSQWEIAKRRAKLFMLGASCGTCLGIVAIVGVKTGQHAERERFTESMVELRLSERKTPYMTPDLRKTAFEIEVVPKYNLQRESLDYRVLETACITGVYGSKADDFSVSTDKVKFAYNACGWMPASDK